MSRDCLFRVTGLGVRKMDAKMPAPGLPRFRRLSRIACLAVAICCGARSGFVGWRPQNAPAAGDRDQTYRVKVEMVSLPVVVTDREGGNVKNLKPEDFRVLDNGVAQEIAGFAAVQEPISVALMLDTSGSTRFQLGRIQNEAIRFINALRPDDSIAILSVSDEVTLLEQFSIYHTKDASKVRQARPGWLSAIYEGVWFALEKVLKVEDGRKALVFLSDGVDTLSKGVTREDTMELARQTEAPIYCIYFDTEQDRSKRTLPPSHSEHSDYTAGRDYMWQLSNYSGGLFVDASRLDSLGAAFRAIVQELSSQYSIGYYPKDLKHDGSFRHVEVSIRIPGLRARTRQGYYDFR